jgi:hypothetical protein
MEQRHLSTHRDVLPEPPMNAASGGHQAFPGGPCTPAVPSSPSVRPTVAIRPIEASKAAVYCVRSTSTRDIAACLKCAKQSRSSDDRRNSEADVQATGRMDRCCESCHRRCARGQRRAPGTGAGDGHGPNVAKEARQARRVRQDSAALISYSMMMIVSDWTNSERPRSMAAAVAGANRPTAPRDECSPR